MKTLKELIKNRVFRIPNYQRGYSWDKRQLEELIGDIENIKIINDRSFHFTGIVSYSEYKTIDFNQIENVEFNEEESLEIYHVADGQQRLTTLFILLFEVYRVLYKEENFQTKFSDSFIIFDKNGNRVYRFGYDVDVPSREHLYKIIFEDDSYKIKYPETLYTINLDNAKKTVQDYLSQKDEGQVKRFKRKIEQRLLFQEFVIDTKRLDVSMVFETMNYRGKSLSKLELFKNRLIYLVGNKFILENEILIYRKEITNAWLNVYSWLGKKSESKLNDDAFLSSFTIIHFNNRKTIDSVFKKIIDRIFLIEYPIKKASSNPNLNEINILRLTESIKLAVKCYYFTFNPFSEDSDLNTLNIPRKIKKQIYIINQIGGANYIKTLTTCLLMRFIKTNGVEINELLDLLIEIEKHQMIVFNLLGRKMDANRPDIYRICNDIYEGRLSYIVAKYKIKELTEKWWNRRNYKDMIQDNINEYKDRFMGINAFKILLYLKDVDENTTSDGKIKINDYKLILVFSDDHGSNVKFPNVVRSRDPKSINYLRYSLGNIIIIERNLLIRTTALGNNYLEEKAAVLMNSMINKNHLISQKIKTWSDFDILNRGIEILTFLKDRYNLTSLTTSEMRHILIDNVTLNPNQTVSSEEL